MSASVDGVALVGTHAHHISRPDELVAGERSFVVIQFYLYGQAVFRLTGGVVLQLELVTGHYGMDRVSFSNDSTYDSHFVFLPLFDYIE